MTKKRHGTRSSRHLTADPLAGSDGSELVAPQRSEGLRKLEDIYRSALNDGKIDEFHRMFIGIVFLAIQAIAESGNEHLRSQKLNRSHFRALYFLLHLPSLSHKELMLLIGLSHQGVSRIISDLVGAGYLMQLTDADDGRLRRLSITAKGRELEDAIQQSQIRIMKRSFDRFGGERAADALTYFLGMLRDEDVAVVQRLYRADDP